MLSPRNLEFEMYDTHGLFIGGTWRKSGAGAQPLSLLCFKSKY
ncbi:MAG: hypothetical protein ABIN69_10615 [Aestuariivirga sp.]